MYKKLIPFSFLISFLFAFEIENYNSLNELKKELDRLDIHNKIKIQMLFLLKNNNLEDANFLFNLLKKNKNNQNLLENALLIPQDRNVIIVSKNEQKLIVLHNDKGSYKEVFQSPCITGKRQGDKLEAGDKKTPNGVYFPKFFIPEEKLTSIYGKGAFPLNYPNIIDKKIFHKSGNGIWLHATDDDNRKPFSSNGCVVVTNDNFLKLKQFVHPKNTPVVIVDNFAKIDSQNFEKVKLSLGNFIYQWKKAWQKSINGNIEPYISFYSKHLVSDYGDFSSFKKYKQSVASGKKWIKIKLHNVYLTKDGRVLDYGHIYVAAFDMEYSSNNYTWSGKKIIYIIKENGQWKILAEENL